MIIVYNPISLDTHKPVCRQTMKGLQVGLLLFYVAGSLARHPKAKDRCKDDMLHLADGRYSCNLLVDRSDPYQRVLGVYSLRKDLCSEPGFSGCCKTCRDYGLVVQNKRRKHKKSKHVYQTPTKAMSDEKRAELQVICEDRMLNVADGFYACSLLTDPHHWNQKNVGAYYRRRDLCSKHDYSGCCKTCNEVLLEVTSFETQVLDVGAPIKLPVKAVNGIELNPLCKDSGLMLDEGTFSCTILVEEPATTQTSKRALANRDSLCNLPGQSGCCLTCTLNGFYKIKERETDGDQVSFTTTERKRRHPGFCRDSNLWLGDGSYDCSLLVDKHHKKQKWLGVYTQRKRLCSKAGFSGCCNTCVKHVIKRNTRRCMDEYVFVSRNKKTYACRELLHQRSDIYTDRFDLCVDKANTRCCRTCAKVTKTKHQHGSHRRMNMIDKPQTIEIVNFEVDVPNSKLTSRDAVKDVNRVYRFMKAILHRLSQFVPDGYNLYNHHGNSNELAKR